MKLMGKGNQVSKPENQITIAASPMNKSYAKVVIDSNTHAHHWIRQYDVARAASDLICWRIMLIKY